MAPRATPDPEVVESAAAVNVLARLGISGSFTQARQSGNLAALRRAVGGPVRDASVRSLLAW